MLSSRLTERARPESVKNPQKSTTTKIRLENEQETGRDSSLRSRRDWCVTSLRHADSTHGEVSPRARPNHYIKTQFRRWRSHEDTGSLFVMGSTVSPRLRVLKLKPPTAVCEHRA